jgi:hypothetical protein
MSNPDYGKSKKSPKRAEQTKKIIFKNCKINGKESTNLQKSYGIFNVPLIQLLSKTVQIIQ